MDLFYCRFVLTILFSLHAMMAWIILHLPVRCCLDMTSMTYFTVVSNFLIKIRIHVLVIFLTGNDLLHGIIFVEWET